MSKKPNTATLTYDGKNYDLPVHLGTEGELGIDISQLRKDSGLITFDPGYGNTGSCKSAITYVDGENGILRYRGYPIEDIAEKSTFIETAMLLIFGELPTQQELSSFRELLSEHELLNEDLLHHFDGFPSNGDPMSLLSAVVSALSCYHPDLLTIDGEDHMRLAVANMISKIRTIAAFSYRKSMGLPFMYPDPKLRYCVNFLHMMFSLPFKLYEPPLGAVRALSLFLILHADHEQNCSCSTVRMVGSTQTNMFASISAGVSALWGPLHGGANSAVINMLTHIRKEGIPIKEYLERVKKKEFRLMGFGHRIYKNFDPRAKLLKSAAHNLLLNLGRTDELLELAQEMEEAALNDEYFVERSLYPNVDFYSGIILRALGIPVSMFPVMFSIGRLPGWIAHWYEDFQHPSPRIHRPRQIYTGPAKREYVPINKR